MIPDLQPPTTPHCSGFALSNNVSANANGNSNDVVVGGLGLYNTATATKHPFHKKMECLMCDDVKVVGSTPLDLHKHLVEKHFRDRLLDLIPSIGSSIGGKPRFCCPFQGPMLQNSFAAAKDSADVVAANGNGMILAVFKSGYVYNDT